MNNDPKSCNMGFVISPNYKEAFLRFGLLLASSCLEKGTQRECLFISQLMSHPVSVYCYDFLSIHLWEFFKPFGNVIIMFSTYINT